MTVVDLRSEGGWPEGFPVFAGSTILSAHGRRRVSAVSVGTAGSTSGQKVSCDLVVNACVQTPSTNLLAQAGARLAFDEALQAFLPDEMPTRTWAVGAVAGARSPEACGAHRADSRVSRPRRRRDTTVDAASIDGAPERSGASRGSGRPATGGLGGLRASSSRASAWT